MGVEAPEEPSPVKAKEGKGKKKGKKLRVEKSESEPELLEPQKNMPSKKEIQSEGQLAIDVCETDEDFIVQSTIAGIKPEDLDISVENDLVTIRGSREKTAEERGEKYLYQECYWGEFSRQVILPEEVDGSRATASIKNGVLTLKIPKVHRKKTRKIVVKQEE